MLNRKDKKNKFTAIDLFSGAGGLTLGLKNGGFKVVAAVEIDKDSVDTYHANHPEVQVIHDDIRKVKGKEILRRMGLKNVDLVAGCPPCQGFSKLTDKNRKNDPRNELVLEMARMVEELRPSVCMMENVPGLASRGKNLLDEFEKKIKSLGYIITKGVLQMADYGVPQSRRRLVLLAGRGFKIELPKATHCRTSEPGLKRWVSVKSVLEKSKAPVTYLHAKENGGPEKFNWNVVRDVKPITLERLKYLIPGKSRLSLPVKLRPNCHKEAKGFSNVYGRMSSEEVAPTMTSGCTTLSAGRFGHPVENRTISVREAAMIQTFPESYQFKARAMESVCGLVGNALPFKFAKIVSEDCYEALNGLE